MADGVLCGQCGEPILGESPDGSSERRPCPKCGSLTRNFQASAVTFAASSCSAAGTVVTYQQRLLMVAQGLIDSGEFSVAIVVVHMACEIATERALSNAFVTKGVDYLKDWAVKNLGYNLNNDRVHSLYTRLTGDAVNQTSFWSGFETSSKLRNDIIHAGVIASKQNAEDSLHAGESLVAHLKK